MGMPKTVQKLHKESNQDLIEDEVEAIDNYDRAIDGSDNPEAIATYEHIKGEEQEHIAELQGLDKMKTDEMTSEQAWEDFKSGYSDFEEKHIGKGRDGDQASLEEKIDVLSAKISELNTDMSRLTDSVPQALGTIEEGKTLEDEAEEQQEEQELAGEMAGGEEGAEDGEDDYLGDDFFGGDDGLEDEDAVGGEDVPADDTDSEGETAEDEEIADDTDADGESIDEGEQVADDDATDESSADDDDMEAIDIDEDESDTAVDEDVDVSDETETASDDEETVEDDEEEKVIDKMVRVLEKMDRRITHLERENAGLKKQLAQRVTVQTEPRNLAKSRPTPNTNLKLVKGSYNRPPVSTQYVANQRDIGIGKKTESSNTSVIRQGLNEVFENCERIAHQTN